MKARTSRRRQVMLVARAPFHPVPTRSDQPRINPFLLCSVIDEVTNDEHLAMSVLLMKREKRCTNESRRCNAGRACYDLHRSDDTSEETVESDIEKHGWEITERGVGGHRGVGMKGVVFPHVMMRT